MFYKKPLFSMTELQIEKEKKLIRIDKKQGHIVKLLINKITMKFHELLAKPE